MGYYDNACCPNVPGSLVALVSDIGGGCICADGTEVDLELSGEDNCWHGGNDFGTCGGLINLKLCCVQLPDLTFQWELTVTMSNDCTGDKIEAEDELSCPPNPFKLCFNGLEMGVDCCHLPGEPIHEINICVTEP